MNSTQKALLALILFLLHEPGDTVRLKCLFHLLQDAKDFFQHHQKQLIWATLELERLPQTHVSGLGVAKARHSTVSKNAKIEPKLDLGVF